MHNSTPIAPRPRWNTATKIFVVALIALATFSLLSHLQIIVVPFVLAVMLAYILNPLVTFINRRARIPRVLVLILIYILVIAVISLLVVTATQPLIEQIQNLMAELPGALEDIEAFFDREIVLGPFSVDLSGVVGEAETMLLEAAQSLGSESISFLGEVLAGLAEIGVTLIFMFLVSFYLVKDGHKAMDWFLSQVPHQLESDIRHLVGEIDAIWSSFFVGQIILTLVVSIIIGIISTIIGLPVPLLMGVLAGLLELLPSLGHGIWLVIAVSLALFSGSTWDWMPLTNFWFAVVLAALHMVFQQVDLNYIIPRVIGRRVHLHPLVVIMGILIGASLGGILGIFLAAPTIASLRVLSRYVYANLLDQDPFPPGLADEEE